MPDQPLTMEQILSMLAAGPPHIAALTAGLASAQLHTSPNPGEWSANDVLAHLRACADMWGSCIVAIITQDRPTLRAVNPRMWIKKNGLSRTEILAVVARFCHAAYRSIGSPGVVAAHRLGAHSDRHGGRKGPRADLLSYAQWMATHERPHLKQIERIASAMRM